MNPGAISTKRANSSGRATPYRIRMMSFKIYRSIQRIPLLIKLTILSNGCLLLFLVRDIIVYFCSFLLFIIVLFLPIVGGIFVITLIWSGGTLHVSRYCVTQGIAISYEWISERDLALQVTLVPESKCKRH